MFKIEQSTYKELNVDPINSICHGINQILHKFHSEGLLNKKMVDFCSSPRKSRFLKKYINHQWAYVLLFPPTENISQFIDYWLQTLMKVIPSYLKDTTKLTNQLKELTVEPDMPFDVKSLYTCIPHKEGIQACAEALENLKANNPDQPKRIP